MTEPNWEFEAPHFIDFEANEHQLPDNAEEYFDNARESNCFPSEFDPTSGDEPTRDFQSLNISAKAPPQVRFDTPPRPDHEPQSDVAATPSRETFCVKTPSRITRSSNGVSTPITRPVVGKENKAATPTKILSNLITPSRLAGWNRTANQNKVAKKVVPRGTPLRRSLRQNVTSNEPPTKKPKTIPNKQIPKVEMRRSGIPHAHAQRERHLTSEERELAKIKEMREAAKRFKEKGKKLVQKLESSAPAHHKPHVTQPREFHFKTDERATKTHSMTTRADTSDHGDFAHELRRYAPSPVAAGKRTVVKPFRFAGESKKRKSSDPDDKPAFVPMAKAIIDFHTRTPRRYKTASKKAFQSGPVKALHPTMPKTPNLTKTKSRPIATVSAREKEELEIQDIRNYKFKANPVKASILKGPAQAKVERKSPTVPVEFHLSTTRRSNHSHMEESHVEEVKPFRAQPVPQFVFEKPSAVEKKTHITIPMSPAFALKNRLKPKIRSTEAEEPQHPTFYHPPPDPSRAFAPKISSSRTQPKPFSFDERDKTRFAKKEEKIKEMKQKEDEPRHFKAQPMPIVDSPTSSLPPKNPKKPTTAEPFRLKCDERAAARVDQWKQQVDDEVREMREKAEFKAATNVEKITKGKPWEPKLPHRPPTQPLDIVLCSDMRAKEREEYERKVLEEVEEQKRKDEEEKERIKAQEQEEVNRMRREMVHKAQDIHFYKPVEVAKSSKTLTVPESPKFSTRFKK